MYSQSDKLHVVTCQQRHINTPNDATDLFSQEFHVQRFLTLLINIARDLSALVPQTHIPPA